MCIPKPQKPVPQASTLPTTQAADELELAGEELTTNLPSGRLALSTRPRSATSATTASSAGAALTAPTTAVPVTASPDAPATAGEALTGKFGTKRQPFYGQANEG